MVLELDAALDQHLAAAQERPLLVRRLALHVDRPVPARVQRIADAAAAAGLSERRAYEWLKRFRAGGERALQDRRSTPACSPHAVPAETVADIERLRRERLTGEAIARQLGPPRSTISGIPRRLGRGRLSALDPKPAFVR